MSATSKTDEDLESLRATIRRLRTSSFVCDHKVADYLEHLERGGVPSQGRHLLAGLDENTRAATPQAPGGEGGRQTVPADVHESGWQWRPVSEDTAFAPPFGTIRTCRHCGCLVAGGPTACVRCAEGAQVPAPSPAPNAGSERCMEQVHCPSCGGDGTASCDCCSACELCRGAGAVPWDISSRWCEVRAWSRAQKPATPAPKAEAGEVAIAAGETHPPLIAPEPPACPAIGPCGHRCAHTPGAQPCELGYHGCGRGCGRDGGGWKTPPAPEATHGLDGRPLGEGGDLLKSLPPDQLAKVSVPTESELRAALDAGAREAAIARGDASPPAQPATGGQWQPRPHHGRCSRCGDRLAFTPEEPDSYVLCEPCRERGSRPRAATPAPKAGAGEVERKPTCPNCHRWAPGGLFSSESGVRHCGCYHEDPRADHHVSRDDAPAPPPPCPAIEPETGHACAGHRADEYPEGDRCQDGMHFCGGDPPCKTWRTPPHPEATHGLDGRPLGVTWAVRDDGTIGAGEHSHDLAGRALGGRECPAREPGTGHRCYLGPSGDCAGGEHLCAENCPLPTWRTAPHPEAEYDLAGNPLVPPAQPATGGSIKLDVVEVEQAMDRHAEAVRPAIQRSDREAAQAMAAASGIAVGGGQPATGGAGREGVTIIVMGMPIEVPRPEASEPWSKPAREALARAAAAPRSGPRFTVDGYELRDERGTLLDPHRPSGDYGSQLGGALFLTVAVGAGGAEANPLPGQPATGGPGGERCSAVARGVTGTMHRCERPAGHERAADGDPAHCAPDYGLFEDGEDASQPATPRGGEKECVATALAQCAYRCGACDEFRCIKRGSNHICHRCERCPEPRPESRASQLDATPPGGAEGGGGEGEPNVPTRNHRLTDAEVCRRNGWGPGDVLEGDEGYGPERIKILWLGEERIFVREEATGRESGSWTLTCRDWRRVVTAAPRPASPPVQIAPGVERHLGRCGGQPVVAGTRVLTGALWAFARDGGHSAERIQRQYPHLSLAQINAALAFEGGRTDADRARDRGDSPEEDDGEVIPRPISSPVERVIVVLPDGRTRTLAGGRYVEFVNPDGERGRQTWLVESDDGEPLEWREIPNSQIPPASQPATPRGGEAISCLACNDHGVIGDDATGEPCEECTPEGAVVAARRAFGAAVTAILDAYGNELLAGYQDSAESRQRHHAVNEIRRRLADKFGRHWPNLVPCHVCKQDGCEGGEGCSCTTCRGAGKIPDLLAPPAAKPDATPPGGGKGGGGEGYEWKCPACGERDRLYCGTGIGGSCGHTGDGADLETVPCEDAHCRECNWSGRLPPRPASPPVPAPRPAAEVLLEACGLEPAKLPASLPLQLPAPPESGSVLDARDLTIAVIGWPGSGTIHVAKLIRQMLVDQEGVADGDAVVFLESGKASPCQDPIPMKQMHGWRVHLRCLHPGQVDSPASVPLTAITSALGLGSEASGEEVVAEVRSNARDLTDRLKEVAEVRAQLATARRDVLVEVAGVVKRCVDSQKTGSHYLGALRVWHALATLPAWPAGEGEA